MYTLLNDNVVRVSVVGGKGSLATLTFYEQSSIQNVMDGDLDGFINAFLTMRAEN